MPVPEFQIVPGNSAGFRNAYRQEMACQIVHDSYHRRGFMDTYLAQINEKSIAYASLCDDQTKARDTIGEFNVEPAHRAWADEIFLALAKRAQARHIVAQTNDRGLLIPLLAYGKNVQPTNCVFSDQITTNLQPEKANFRPLTPTEKQAVFHHKAEPVGEHGIEFEGRIVATGGYLTHYNPPFCDIYMEVDEPFRRRGFGSCLVQGLKRLAHENGLEPCARCDFTNAASKATLSKAGLLPCALILHADLDL